MNTEHATRILPSRSRLPTKARRVSHIAARQIVENFVGVERRQRHFRGPDMVEFVALNFVDIDRVRWKESCPVHCVVPDENWRQYRHVASLHNALKRKAV